MRKNGATSTPRRHTHQEPIARVAGTPATVPDATGDIRNAIKNLAIEPTHADIARRAYQLYEERGGDHGADWHDWFRAERELRQFLHDAVGRFLAAEGFHDAA